MVDREIFAFVIRSIEKSEKYSEKNTLKKISECIGFTSTFYVIVTLCSTFFAQHSFLDIIVSLMKITQKQYYYNYCFIYFFKKS